jgi:hypothetical protein
VKIAILCRIHGEFLVTPNNHLNKMSGCPQCAINLKADKKRMHTREFIKKAHGVHNDKYDYSESKFYNTSTEIEIICPHHGSFVQKPSKHMAGQGCPKCNKSFKHTTESFVAKANKIHGNKYDYSEVNYTGNEVPITIICKLHGSFTQKPVDHISGCGCKVCGRVVSHKETEFLNYLNIAKDCRQYKSCCVPYVGNVDGFDPTDNTVYEFLGDFWHGNPDIYNYKKINEVNNQSFGDLYTKTINKFEILTKNGYNIKYIWERDWDLWKSVAIGTIPVKIFSRNQPI